MHRPAARYLLLSGRREPVYTSCAMNDPDLDRLLRAWRAPDVPADSFRRGVWERIAQADASVPAWVRWLDAFLRPRVALAGFAAALIAGTAGGLVHAAWKQKTVP